MALSRSGFNRLVTDHGDVLYRMAYRLVGNPHEAEDLVQEAFRSAWKSRLGYQHGRGDRAWLASILRRRIADRYRRRRLNTVSLGEGIDQFGVADRDPVEQQYSDEMQRALNRLTDEMRETLLLVVVAELTHQEAAKVLDIPLGTVLSRVSRARQQLRQALLAERVATQ